MVAQVIFNVIAFQVMSLNFKKLQLVVLRKFEVNNRFWGLTHIIFIQIFFERSM